MKDYLDSDDAKNLMTAAKRETQEYERSKMSDEPGTTETLRSAAERMGASKPESRVSGAPKNFRQAFAEARKAGDKTFTWNGKKYTTELAKPASAAPKAEPAKAEPAKATPPSRPRISQARGSMKEKMREMGVTRYKSGGSVSASKRADGCAVRGKTRGKMV
jgi:hypothetical protein